MQIKFKKYIDIFSYKHHFIDKEKVKVEENIKTRKDNSKNRINIL